MIYTGERLIPSKFSNNSQLYIEHMSRYMFASDYVKDRTVLDAGCGCGYGSAHLSQFARKVIGIDISKEAIDYCNSNYTGNNINFKQMSCYDLGFPQGSFDVVVSFEVIEH